MEYIRWSKDWLLFSRLEQFKNEYSWISEIFDKIVIDFNSVHSSNKCDEITSNWGGNLIVLKLTQCENVLLPI